MKKYSIVLFSVMTIVAIFLVYLVGYKEEKVDKKLNDENGDTVEFLSLFDSAVVSYSFFTSFNEPDFDYNDVIDDYYCVISDNFTKKDSMKAYLLSIFSPEITEKLMNTEVDIDMPLYREINGTMYRFGGYVSQYSYDSVETKLSSIEYEEDKITLNYNISSLPDDDFLSCNTSYNYVLVKNSNGKYVFNEFELPIKVCLNSIKEV